MFKNNPMNKQLPASLNNYIHCLNEDHDQYSNPVVETGKINFATSSDIYNAIFENSFHAVYISAVSGRILRFNKKLCKIFGYTRNEMISIEALQLFDIYEDGFNDFINKRIEKGIAKAEVTAIKKSGETFPCRISSVFYKSDYGENRLMNTLVDISDNLASRWDITG